MSELPRSDSPHHWDAYASWDDSTRYSRDWIVDQNHPAADDANPGTDDAPLKTISAAARQASPGERVRVRSGTYRETVRPRTGGAGPDAMIHYTAQPGESVIVSGSVILDTSWERPRYWMDRYRDSPLTASWSRRVWITTLPETCFEDGYQPFALKNIEEAEYALMPWTEPVVNTPPFTLKRGLLFQDGRRLVQLHHEGDVRRVEGSFWVDVDNRSLHLHPFGGENPNRSLIEVAVREHIFCPQSVGLDYLRISGLTFQHCANGFLRTGSGAVTTRGGQAWIIENNTIREANSSGLEFGFMPFEKEDPRMRDVPDKRSHFGGTIVRNNHIHDCGTAGIRSHHVKEARVLGNTIHHCGWQEGEFYWECSGIKLLLAENTLVSGNHIHDITAGTGIWMDWDNRYSRVTRNLIHDVNSQQGGIFIEASRTPGMVDRNVIWNVDGNGIYGGECENQCFLHNLVGRVTDAPVLLKKHTDRSLHGSSLLNENNTVSGNCFFDTSEPVIESGTHVFRSNLYLSSRGCLLMNPAEWRQRGIEQSPCFAEADLSFDPRTRCLSRVLPGDGPFPPPAPEIRSDFHNQPWPPEASTAGPFIARAGKSRIHL
jgi:hypothetical protein